MGAYIYGIPYLVYIPGCIFKINAHLFTYIHDMCTFITNKRISCVLTTEQCLLCNYHCAPCPHYKPPVT